MLLPNLSEQVIRRAVAEYRAELLSQRGRYLEELEDFYIGGSDMSEHIRRFEGEEQRDLNERRARFQYPNYVAKLANVLIDSAYGAPIKRKIRNASEAQQKQFDAILEWNSATQMQLEVGQSIVTLGDAWACVAFREIAKTVGILPVYPGHIVHVAYDPENPRQIVQLVERRMDDGNPDPSTGKAPILGYWFWTVDEFAFVDQEGAYITPPQRNAYRAIPYVRWIGEPVIGERTGLSYIRDLIPLAKALINRLSELDQLVIDQTFSTLVTAGHEKPTFGTGTKRWVGLQQGGTAEYITPDPRIEAVEAAVDGIIQRMCETVGVPRSLLQGGIASSGRQLELEMWQLVQRVQRIRSINIDSERELCRLVCLVGATHRLGLPPSPDVEVEFDSQILPTDRQVERQEDRADVDNIPPLMTREDYVRKYRSGLNTDEAVRGYIVLLDAQDRDEPGARKPGTDADVPTPPVPPEDEEPSVPPPNSGKSGYEQIGGGGGP